MDNANMKTRSIRAEETVLEQFKELSEQFPNQSVALESLLNAYKMQTAKAKVVTRQTEIDNFDSHLQALSSAFVNSIELTENTKQRIRGEFQQQLESKDKTIIELQSKEETANVTSAELKKKLKAKLKLKSPQKTRLSNSLRTNFLTLKQLWLKQNNQSQISSL